MDSKLFIDASVVAEILFYRTKSQACVKLLANETRLLCISVLTVHLLYHFRNKYRVSRELVDEFLTAYYILPMDQRTVQLGQKRLDSNDFEDCLQAACAELGECNEILTLDKTFAKDSGTKLPVRVIG